jgi:multicomponent Na+:H+ antiporter subunit A
MPYFLLAPFVIALGVSLLNPRISSKLSAWMAIVPLAILIYLLYMFGQHPGKVYPFDWTSGEIPFALDIRLDGLGLLFAMLISGIGTLIFWYAHHYMKGHAYRMRLLLFLCLFMGAMLGLVLSDHVISMFVFWELTSISSFFLIGFDSHNSEAIKSARKALFVTGAGGLILFAGLIIIGQISGGWTFSQWIANAENIVKDSNSVYGFALILIGSMSKSAQFPFHFWLPGAMKAPTPVSAYLHSATMVKAGVYLLLRLSPVFTTAVYWSPTLLWVGGITLLYAAFHSIYRSDLKSILAYSTISALGLMVFLIGFNTESGLYAAGLFVLIHALYKAPLFLITGIIDHKTGTRNIHSLRGLWPFMPWVAVAGTLAALANAGIPPSLGFIGKDLMYESALGMPNAAILLIVLISSKVFLSVAGFKAGIMPFWGNKPTELTVKSSPEIGLWIAPLLLAVLSLLTGLIPSIAGNLLMPHVLASIFLNGNAPELHLWHGFNFILGLSALTIVCGIGLYYILRKNTQIEQFMMRLDAISPESIWKKIFSALEQIASKASGILQNGYLRSYVLIIVIFLCSLLGYKLLNGLIQWPDIHTLTEITIYELITVAILISAVIFTLFSTSRLVAIAALGVIGLCICLIFVFYSAPDLAMTQFTIDTLTVILFVLVLYRLPRFIPIRFSIRHVRDGIVALGLGGIMGLLSFAVIQYEPSREISAFYTDNSYILAKGKNVVNVILVDFRGADTLIEVVVLSIAAIGVYSLLKLHLKREEKTE